MSTYIVESTIKMELAKRLDGWFPKRCESGSCQGHAWWIQSGKTKSGITGRRVVCQKHKSAKKWRVD